MDYTKYREAAKFFKCSVHSIINGKIISPDASKYILDLYNEIKDDAKSNKPNIYSNCSLFCYNYGRSIKMLLTKEDGEIIGDDPFWLARIPIVSEKGGRFYLQKAGNKTIAINNKHQMTPLIHHNHFGHLIGDCLGRLESIKADVPEAHLVSMRPKSHIETEINESLTDSMKVEWLTCPEVNQSVQYTNMNIMHPTEHPWLYNLFLLKRKYNMQGLTQQSKRNVAFLLRDRLSGSRIINLHEILKVAEWVNASIINAESYSLSQLAKVLSTYKVVITEAGSCHLNAMILCPETTKIVALLPSEMLARPSLDIIIGGWKYIPFHSNIEYLVSNYSRPQKGTPMTAWKGYYQPNLLNRKINDLLM